MTKCESQRLQALKVAITGLALATLCGCVTWVALLLTGPLPVVTHFRVLTEPTVPPAINLPPTLYRNLPALFGHRETGRPPQSDPQEKAHSASPLAQGYQLTGLIVLDSGSWAILKRGTASHLVAEGDVMADGAVITSVDSVGVTFVLNNETHVLSPSIEPRPNASPKGPVPETPKELTEIEISVGKVSTVEISRLLSRAGTLGPRSPVTGGLPVTWVRQGQFLSNLGLVVGDVIVSINQKPVVQLADRQILQQAISNDGRMTLDVIQKGQPTTLRVRFVGA